MSTVQVHLSPTRELSRNKAI
ncbi:hypothetical protein Goarm_013276 [Gossypium armourianum]|uniref:Uncharacterized protein n=1 Tax=Gossypium armourianum TaxID=34283 RepID=A0A7J9J3B8_9ROSI|nr:hypothetical protein [Gossypium armourianum]